MLWALLLFAANLLAAARGYRRSAPRGRFFREGVVLLLAMAGLAFAVCTLADVSSDGSRALYSFHALMDLILIADAGWCVQALAERRGAYGP
jgi:hypothetical protein